MIRTIRDLDWTQGANLMSSYSWEAAAVVKDGRLDSLDPCTITVYRGCSWT